MLEIRVARKDDGKTAIFLPVFMEDVKKLRIGKEEDVVLKRSSFKAEKLTTLNINLPKRQTILVGLGKKKEFNEELAREYGMTCAGAGESLKLKRILVSADIRAGKDEGIVVKSIVEGAVLSMYSFDKYVTDKKRKKKWLRSVSILTGYRGAPGIVKEALTVCKGTIMVRDMVNENSKDKTPEKFERFVRKECRKSGLRLKVFDEKKLKAMGMNLLLAVNRGSGYPARMLIVEYRGNPKSKEKIAFVGKGITFDSGGYNLKPTGYIETMKSDMAGAATAFAVVKVASELGLKKNLVAVMPLTDNAIGPKAYKPGDVFVSYSGKTVEIKNTDAEGRLILADAIAYTVKNIKPSLLIDMATLTGAVLVIFDEFVAAMVSNSKKHVKELFQSGQRTYERVWELPLYEEFEESMKGKNSDLSNTSSLKGGGTITAAAFLKQFVGKNTKWVHLDIAGTAWSENGRKYIPKGGTGFGVRLLIDFLGKGE